MESVKEENRKKHKNDDYRDERPRYHKRARSKSRSPTNNREKNTGRKRRYSQSPEVQRKHDKKDNNTQKSVPTKTDAPENPVRRAKETDMLNTRTGGAYIPPARLRMMQAQITDKSSSAYQRLAWEALKKSIHGHINKINVGNIGIIIKELLKENIVRGRGLLCRSVIQAQAASPTFTNVYAALVAAVNSRFPNIGELLLKRLVIQFKRGFKRNDKAICISSASFIAHLVNQRVAHEILALELLTLLVETPTDDSVEVAIAFLKECGQKLTEVSSKGVNAIFEMLRNILHEGQLDKRVQYMIEVMFQVWKDGFKDHPALIEELELVPEEEQFTHLLMLDDATDPQDILNVFKFDDKFEENEQKYKSLSKDILGSDESGEEGASAGSGSEESDEEDEEEEKKEMTIIDNTETNLVALRRTIYLTINSSLDFEECAHKLMKMQLKPGQEVELCHMCLDCCAEQRTYEKFYGLLAQRFCNINRMYIGPFEEIFRDSYSTAHRLDTNRLRNVSKFFAHLLFTDSISWEVLESVKLNEEDTTSSSRIYIKILFQELAEYMGLKKLNDRLQDPTLQDAFSGIFPRDNPRNTRFSINFFTSIGLGGLTDELREHLKQMPKNVPAPVADITLESEDDSSSSSSSSSSSNGSSSSSDSSSSDTEEESNKKNTEKKKSKKKNKDERSKTPQEDNTENNKAEERWGHDGFYDTYGKDARRTEPRQGRDTFARPHDVRKVDRNKKIDPRREGQQRETQYGSRSEEEPRRSRNDRRYERSPEEEPRRSRDDRRYEKNPEEEPRRSRDDRRYEKKPEEEPRRSRDDRRYEKNPEEEPQRSRDDRRYEKSPEHIKKRNDTNKDKSNRSRYEDTNGRRYDRDDNNKHSSKSRHSRDDDGKDDSRNRKEVNERRTDKENGQKHNMRHRRDEEGRNTNQSVKKSSPVDSRIDNRIKGDKKSDKSENYDHSRDLEIKNSKGEVSGRYWDTCVGDHNTSPSRTPGTPEISRERRARS